MRGARGSGGVALSPSEVQQLRDLIDRLGDSEAARRLCVHRSTVTRAALGRPLFRSTAKLLSLSLAEASAP